MTKIKIPILSLAFLLTFLSFAPALAAQSVDSHFNPNRLIEDRVFSDKKAMGSSVAIQKFLEEKHSVLADTSSDFIALLKEPSSEALKTTLEDPQPGLNRLRSAAELIWDASQSSGLNPQVILVTLQKEQSLITGRKTSTPEQIKRALDISLGFGCPDSGGCGDIYVGFYHQLFGNVDAEGNRYLGATKSLMKSFSIPGGRGPYYNGAVAKVGDTIKLGNTLGGYDGIEAEQAVKIENSATAALYRYTPHVFNGNYNFFRYMKEWFGGGKGGQTITSGPYVDGTIIKNSKKYYYIQGGSRYLITKFVEKARKLKTKKTVSVSSKDLAKIPDAGTLGLEDNTVVKTNSGLYVFIGNRRYTATESALALRGLSSSKAVSTTEAELKDFGSPLNLPPAEGAVLKGDKSTQVYLVENAQLRKVSSLVFEQRNLAGRVQTIPESELAQYPQAGYAVPDDGTVVMVRGQQTVFIILNKLKRPVPSVAVLKTYGKTFADIKFLSKEELDALSVGEAAEAKDPTYYQIEGTGQLWVYRNKNRHYIAPMVAKQRSITPDVTIKQAESDAWPEGDSILPRDGTLLKSDKAPAVYIVESGELLALSASQFKSRGLSYKDLVVYPDSDVKKFIKSSSAQ